MVSESDRRCVIYHVKDRTTKTLWNIVRKHVNENDLPTDYERFTKKEEEFYKLHTDGWASYLAFDFNKIKRLHKRNIHSNDGKE